MRHACDLLVADGAGVAIGTRPPWWRSRHPSQRKYTRWLLSTCTNQQTEPESMVTTEAIDLLASKLHTPLQIGWHRRSKAGFQTAGARSEPP